MKKFLFAFLFILIGLLLGAGAMFAITKLNEKQAPIVETNNDTEDNEQLEDEDDIVTADHEDLTTYAEGYYSVYSQKCDMSFPYPEAMTFEYLQDYGAPAAVGDKNKGWHLSDHLAPEEAHNLFESRFDHQIVIAMTGLPYTEHLGSGYTSANLVISCKEDLVTDIEKLMDDMENSLPALNNSGAFTLTINDIKDTEVNGNEAISFNLSGGMVDLDYIVTRSDTHIYLFSSFVGSTDPKIQNAAEYIVENISI
jgi:hypothetical protein